MSSDRDKEPAGWFDERVQVAQILDNDVATLPDTVLDVMADAMLDPQLRNRGINTSTAGNVERKKILTRSLAAAAAIGWRLQMSAPDAAEITDAHDQSAGVALRKLAASGAVIKTDRGLVPATKGMTNRQNGEDGMTSISQEVVLKMVENLMKFPYPTICRHAIALDLLGALEFAGYELNAELANAVCSAHDDEALAILETLS